MFDVYQIHLTKEQFTMVNEIGPESVPAYEIQRDFSFGPDFHGKETHELASEALDKNYYKKVATFDCDDVREVFQIGNIGPEERITRHEQMHSVSIGDVLVEHNTHNTWVVGRYGYQELNREVAV